MIIRLFMIRLCKCRVIRRLEEKMVAEAECDRVLCLWSFFYLEKEK